MRRAALLGAVAFLAAGACGGRASSLQRVNYPSGEPRWEYQTQGGVPHGASRTYHPNGRVRSMGEYNNGHKHGMFVNYRADGTIESKQFFWRNVQVWISDNPDASPPAELIAGLEKLTGTREAVARPAPHDDEPDSGGLSDLLEEGPLAPLFASLDRTTASSRFGVQLGTGGSAAEGSTAERATLFGHYLLGSYGAFVQLDTSRLRTMTDTIPGRSTLELAATHHRAVAGGELSPRLGVVVPVANDDQAGHEAAAASSFQRPSDAVLSLPSTVAVRTAVSWSRAAHHWVLQGDGGIDWAAGGAGATLRPFGRANAAAGIGTRSAMATIELSNAVRLDAPSQRVHGLGVGGTLWLGGVWAAVLLARTTGAHTTLTAGAGYAF